MIDFKLWPKIELHRHLEGSIRIETIRQLAYAAALPIAQAGSEELRRACTVMADEERSLRQFLTKFMLLRKLITGPEAIQRLAFEAAEDAALDGTIYLELRFNYLHMRRQGISSADIIDALEDGARQAKKQYNITVGYICGIARDLPVEESEEAVDFAIENMHRGILAIDLMNDERFPPALFQRQFMRAKAAGLHVTVHAGESAGPQNIIDAVQLLGAERIGHGARIFQGNSGAPELVYKRNVLVECCLTSNVQTGAVSSLQEHPLIELDRLGVPLCLNTDDPGVSGITLSGEYAVASETMGMGKSALYNTLYRATEHIFMESEKDVLRQRIIRYGKENHYGDNCTHREK